MPSRYHVSKGSSKSLPSAKIPNRIWWILLGIIGLVVFGVVVSHNLYNNGLKPVSDSQANQIFTVKSGSSVKQIAGGLEDDHLIRSAWAFQLYAHSKELTDKFQTGTYALSPSQSSQEIVATLTRGKVATKLVTILPGRRIDQVRADMINAGFAPAAVDKALDPSNYTDLPVIAFKPTNVNTLEGLLWPDSYLKQPDTDPAVIIRESLVAMGQQLTPDVQASFASEGLTTYQGLIIASIVTQEVSKPTDQAQAAQVFLSRLSGGMMLGSDVTANYGAIAAGRAPDLNYDSPYNTLLHAGLPPTPISTVTASSLTAATHPSATSWLYFVAGDDGTTYFSKTLEEHQALADKYCHKLCGR
ncbi:MAG TPA: endolytic transglycosylase MltG [Methylomirabilota bacterium]|nr:endolytic transglycosylase MltG [Methylomirabilota bacterium]